jgi:hypothetical protein
LPIESEKTLVDRYKGSEFDDEDLEIYGGIIFDEDFDYINGTNEIPALNYTIRFGSGQTSTETRFLFPFFQLSGPGESGRMVKTVVMATEAQIFSFSLRSVNNFRQFENITNKNMTFEYSARRLMG